MARPRRLPKVLTPDEQRALLAQFNKRYASSQRNRLLIELMLRCGLRCGEAIALKTEHLDLVTCRLIVRQGKGRKDRTLWFDDAVHDLIVRWLERRPPSDWLLPTRHGTQLNCRYVREMTKRRALSAGIPEGNMVSPHTLRHTFATDLLRETKNIRLVQKALGHANLATTMIYTHVADEELEKAMRRSRSPQGSELGGPVK
jgi:integrase/recombinase XerD